MKKLVYILFPFLILIASCKEMNKEGKKEETLKKQNTKPNIIFIYADDLGYGDINAYGSEEIQTPNMDKLADGGVLFGDLFS